jgi:hypothetical protein
MILSFVIFIYPFISIQGTSGWLVLSSSLNADNQVKLIISPPRQVLKISGMIAC